MAYKRDLVEADQIFFDADRLIRYAIYEGSPTAEQIAALAVVPVNVAGWELSWTMRKKVSGAALIEKSTTEGGIAIVGVYDPDPMVNTQRVVVTIEDIDTYDPTVDPVVNIKPGNYVYALKRLDEGAETPLAYGALLLLKTAGWE